MTYKTVLMVISNPDHAKRMFDYVAPLVEKWGSHLIGVHTEPTGAYLAMPMGIPDGGVYDMLLNRAKEKAAECKKAAESAASSKGLEIEWRSYQADTGDNARTALSSAYRSDLVVAMQQDPSVKSANYTNIETLLFDTGRPVLLVPYAGNPPSTIKRAMVAWNGSREAARAVFDALPLLKEAQETEVFVVDPEDTRDQSAPFAGSEIASSLARHGINVSVEIERSADISVAATIENRAAETGADLLIMGAYGHSRLREMVFGGATRTILQSMPVMTLMSH